MTRLDNSEKPSKFEKTRLTKLENGKIKSTPTIKISLLDTDGNQQELHTPSSNAKSKGKKQLEQIVIVATTPETTFYSEEQILSSAFSAGIGKQIFFKLEV